MPIHKWCLKCGRTVSRIDIAFANVFRMLSAYLITYSKCVPMDLADFELRYIEPARVAAHGGDNQP